MSSKECPSCHQVSGVEAGPTCPFCSTPFAQKLPQKTTTSMAGQGGTPEAWAGGGSGHTWEDDSQALDQIRHSQTVESVGEEATAASPSPQIFLVALFFLLIVAAGLFFWLS